MKRTWFTIIAAGMLFTAGCAKQEPLYEEPYEAVE